MNQQFYQVGGSLPANSKSYIKREADDVLYKYLKEGKYCYVLNARQVGKSSLRVHTSEKLEKEGYSCVNIDLTSIGGSENIETDAWYLSFVFEIIQQLNLDMDKFIIWWEKHEKLTNKLTVVKLFGEIFDEVVLQDQSKKIIIFIDEVDSILGMKKDFSADDFFAVIRTFYNLRSEDERYNRVSFALFGVATPEDLMRDSTRTPFNIAHSVKLNQFKFKESLVLAEGLADNSVDSQKILEKIFEWTDGTPYLTQKILDYISQNPIDSVDKVDDIVDLLFIKENFKETNISNILTRIMNNSQYNVKMLYIIDELIAKKTVKADDSHKQQIYLKLSGLVKEEKGKLLFSNKIYEQIFNKTWLDETIEKIDRPLTKDLQRWIELLRSTSALLKGDVLDRVREWADGREDLSSLENEYLRLSVEEEQRSLLHEERKKGQAKLIKFLIPALILLSILGYFLFKKSETLKITNMTLKSTNEKLKIAREASISIEKILKNADIATTNNVKTKDENLSNTFEIKKSEEKNITDYSIPDWLKSDDNITEKVNKEKEEVKKDKKLLKDFDIAKEIKNKYEELIQLIYHTESMDDDERQYWFDIMPSMTDSQIDRLYNILETEKRKLEELEVKYQKEIKSLNEKHLIEWQEFQFKKLLDGNISEENIEDFASAIESNNDIATYLKIKKKLNTLYQNNEISKEYNLYLNAVLSLNVKDNNSAIEQYKQLIKLYNIDNFSDYSEKNMSFIIDIYGRLSQIYEDIKDIDKSIELKNKTMDLLKLLVKKFPTKENIEKKFEFTKKLIKTLENNKRYKDAIIYLNKQVSLIRKKKKVLYNDDEDGYKNELLQLYNHLGWTYNKNGNFKEAIKMYKKAIKLNPKSEKTYTNIGICYHTKKEYDKALEFYKKALDINPKGYWNYSNIGMIYNNKKEYDKAIAYQEKAIKINPKYSSAYNSIGNVYDNMKEYNKAIEVYKKAISLDKKNIYPYLNLFELQLCQNLPFDEKLKTEFEKLFKDKKENFIDYEMFIIFKNIINNKIDKIDKWVRKYQYTNSLYEAENFEDLDEWINNQKDAKVKIRLLEVLKILKEHNALVKNHNKKEK